MPSVRIAFIPPHNRYTSHLFPGLVRRKVNKKHYFSINCMPGTRLAITAGCLLIPVLRAEPVPLSSRQGDASAGSAPGPGHRSVNAVAAERNGARNHRIGRGKRHETKQAQPPV